MTNNKSVKTDHINKNQEVITYLKGGEFPLHENTWYATTPTEATDILQNLIKLRDTVIRKN